MFAQLYQLVMQWSQHRLASYWLAVVSFTESAFFIVPPDVMLAPMTLAQPKKAWFYASLTTVTSVLGGLLGYFIGSWALETVMPFLTRWGYDTAYYTAQTWFSQWGFWAVLLAGFTPIPYKIFTIAAGATQMALLPFIVGSLLGRGSRFFLVAGLMRLGGEPLAARLGQWADRLGWGLILLIGLVYGYTALID